MRRLGDGLMQGGLYRTDPKGSDQPVLEVHMARERVRVTNTRQALLKALRSELERSTRLAAGEAARRTVGAAIASMRGGGLVRTERVDTHVDADAGDAVIVNDMHDVGGF